MVYKYLIVMLVVTLTYVTYFTIQFFINDENNIILKEYKDYMINCKK